MMMIFFSSVMSSIGHIAQGHVAWVYSIVLIISSYLGAKIGVKSINPYNQILWLCY